MNISEAIQLSDIFNELPGDSRLCSTHKYVLKAGIGSFDTGSGSGVFVSLACPGCISPSAIQSAHEMRTIMDHMRKSYDSNNAAKTGVNDAQDLRRKIRRRELA